MCCFHGVQLVRYDHIPSLEGSGSICASRAERTLSDSTGCHQLRLHRHRRNNVEESQVVEEATTVQT